MAPLGELAPELGVLELEAPGVEEAPLEVDGLLLSLEEVPVDDDEGELLDEDGVLELEEDGVLLEPAEDDGVLLEPAEDDGVLLEPAEDDGVLLEPADEEDPGALDPVAELPVFDFDDDAPVALSRVPLSQPYKPPTATARGMSANADFLSSFMYSSLKGWRGPLCVARFGPTGLPRTGQFHIVSGMPTFTKVVLFTDHDGRARFRDEPLVLDQGTPQAMLSCVLPASGYQLRRSPVGFRSTWHCTPSPQWVFILAGQMEIGLHDGTSRVFKPGEHFYSADTLPENTLFDANVHGHWSAQWGTEPLVTLFLKI